MAGPDAATYLQRMVSNDVEALGVGESCEALLLTPKARVIAPLRVLRRAESDFLLVTEPDLGERVRAQLLRSRFAAKVEIELEEHRSFLLLGTDVERPSDVLTVPTEDYGFPAVDVLDGSEPENVRRLSEDELEALRIKAGTPLVGKEIDDRVLPAEAGLVERAVSFTKGCYPGQEPVARLHYRGHANRRLLPISIEGDDLPAYDAEVRHDGRVVGRVTSAARADTGIVALAYVRREVADDANLEVGGAPARALA